MARRPLTHAHTRWFAWLGVLAAVVTVLATPRTASAAVTMIGDPIISNGQVTVSWIAPGASSELRWDTERHDAFTEFPSGLPHNVSNTTGLGSSAGQRHSRTISNLPVGSYWFMVRSGSETKGPFAFQLTAAGMGDATGSAWQTSNIVPGTAAPGGAASIDKSAFAPSGADPDTGKLWIAGTFDRVGRPSPPAISADADGRTKPGAPVITGGKVETVIADEDGGSYIGGSFTHVGGIPMRGVAHLLPDGGLDTTFRPQGAGITPTGAESAQAQPTVYALALDTMKKTDVRLYVGGRFDSWKDEGGTSTTIHNLTAIHPSTLGLKSPATVTGTPGATLPTGRFNIGEGARGTAAASWDQGEVRVIVVDQRPSASDRAEDNAGLYAGGRFTRINGHTFSKVAKLEPTGAAAVGHGDCVGNAFICAIADAFVQTPNTFTMNRLTKDGSEDDAIVYTLAYWDPRYIGPVVGGLANANYQPELAVGGSFDEVLVDDGTPFTEPHENFVVLNTMMGAKIGPMGIGGNPTGRDADGIVRSLRVVNKKGAADSDRSWAKYTDDQLYVGGDFTTFYGATRNHVARLNLRAILEADTPADKDLTWQLDPTFDPLTGASAPDPADPDSLSVSSVYVQCNDARLDCGASDAMTPQPQCASVYIGGAFEYLRSGQRYSNLMRVNCSDGSPVPNFRPGQAINGAPHALAYSAGGRLLVGGGFSMYEGRLRPGIAALNVVDGELSGPDVQAGAEPAVYHDDFESWTAGFTGGDGRIDAMTARGDELYVGGSFTHVDAQPRSNVVRIDAGAVSAFAPDPDGAVRAIHVPTSTPGRVWIGGDFTDVASCGGSMPCAHLQLLRASDGAPFNDASDPTPSPNAKVRAFATDGSNVFVGGDFTQVGATPISALAKFDADGHLVSGSPFNAPSSTGDRVTALAYDDGQLYVGGVTEWGAAPDTVHGLVKVDGTSGVRDTDFDPELDHDAPVDENTVRALEVVNHRLLVGGSFTSYDGDPSQNYVSTVSTADGAPVAGFTPIPVPASGPSPVVTTITQVGDSTIIGGDIPSFDGRVNVGGFVSMDSPVDYRAPFLAVTAPGAPAGSHVVHNAAGSITRLVMPYPSDPSQPFSFAVGAEAQDSYPMNEATYATTSGVKTIEFGGIGAAPWGPSGADTLTAPARGVEVACDGDAKGRIAGVAFPSGVTTGNALTCTWTGRVVAPSNGSGQVSFQGNAATTVSVLVDGAMTTVASGDLVDLPPSRSIPIEVTWTKSGSIMPELTWKHVGIGGFGAVEPASFVGSGVTTRTYGFDVPANPPRNGSVRTVALQATDVDGNHAEREVEIGIDGADPQPSSLVSTPARELSAVYSSSSVVIDLETGADDGAAGLATQALVRERIGITDGQCVWTDTIVPQTTQLGALPLDQTYAVAGVNTGLANGCYRFRLVATDNVGNTTTSTLDGHDHTDPQVGWIRIDTSRPGGSISTPVDGATVHGNASLSGSLDAGGSDPITSISVTLDTPGAPTNACTSTPVLMTTSWSCTWDTTNVPDGTYALTLVATNSAAVPASSSPIHVDVLVDNDDPLPSTLGFTAVSGGAHQSIDSDDATKLWVRSTQSGSVRVSLRAQDGAGTGVSSVVSGTGPGAWNFTRDTGSAADGIWSYLYAWDGATNPPEPGLRSATLSDGANHALGQPFTIAFDDDGPQGASAGFAPGTVEGGSTDSVRIAFAPGTDAQSGIAGYDIERVQGMRDPSGACGGFPAFAGDGTSDVVASSPTSGVVFVDDSTVPLACYRYRLVVRDNVGNETPVNIGEVATTQSALLTGDDVRLAEGTVTTFGVRLRVRPALGETVAVTVHAGAHTRGAEPAQVLTFTHGDWSTAQPASVSAVDDLIAQGGEYAGSVRLAIATSGSGQLRYAGAADVLKSITIVDTDTASLELVPVRAGSRGRTARSRSRRAPTARRSGYGQAPGSRPT